MSTNTSTTDRSTSALNRSVSADIRPWILAGIVLGVGQGGFFDGIIFHQLLQWHHMFSSIETNQTVAGMELNTLGDGLFHLFDWLTTLTGIGLMWRAGQRPRETWTGRIFLGSLLAGAGLFNLVEGIIDHHILGIHHLRPGIHEGLWDIAFLLSGVFLIAVGLLFIQTAKPTEAA